MKNLKSPILEAVHQTAAGLHRAGAINAKTLREFDALCLSTVEPLDPEQIKALRLTANVSQAVFAKVLNTSLSTVQKWEVGQQRPVGPALKLLDVIRRRGLDAVA
jgi:putative transcriptional regulator